MLDSEEVYLKKNDMLVTRLEDYYKKDNPFAVTENGKASKYEVGIIAEISKELPVEFLGSIVFYEKDICTKVDLKELGMYDLVPLHYVILVRTDQNENNY